MKNPHACLSMLLGCIASSGCIGGSLATSTGPRRSGTWSEAGHQAAHVGETVKFSFILTKPFGKHPVHPAGLAEYCILQIDDQPVEMELDDGGKFAATYRMPRDGANGEVRVQVTAYRQYGQRDRIIHGTQLMQSDRSADPSDRAIARDTITMLVYQSAVELKVPQGSDELDFSTAQLVVRRTDGAASTVPKYGPSGQGFEVEGPNDAGEFTVRYEPTFAQVNLTGQTEAELTVHDRAGRPQRFRTDFMTP